MVLVVSVFLRLGVRVRVFVRVVVNLVQDIVAQRTPVLHVQPLPQADAVEEMVAARYLRRVHLLVADRAHVVQITELSVRGLFERVDLVDRGATLHKHGPAGSRFAPYVEVRVYAHHDGADRPARFEQQDPGPVEEQENAETEFDCVTESAYVIHVVVQLLPERTPVGVDQE